MATVRGMTPEAIRALLKREVGDYNATLSVANQALSNSMAIGDAISDLDEKLKNLPDDLKEGNADLEKLKGELSDLQKELEGNKGELSSLQDDLKEKEELIKSIQDEMPDESLYVPGNLLVNPTFKTDKDGNVLYWVRHEDFYTTTTLPGVNPSEYDGENVVVVPPSSIIGVEKGHGFAFTDGQNLVISGELAPTSSEIKSNELIFYLWGSGENPFAYLYKNENILPGSRFSFDWNTMYYQGGGVEIESDVRLIIQNASAYPMVFRKMAVQEVTGEWSLQDGVVNVDKIADKAVSTAKIIDNAIVAEKIASNAVIADKIAADAVTTNKLAADAVTAEKIAANAVTTNKLSAEAVVADKIASNAITTDKIAANSIVGDKIAARSIGVQKLLVSAGNLFPDPDFLDPTWGRFSTSEGLRLTANGKQTGTYYSPDGITSYTSMLLEPNAVYRLTLNLRFEASAPLSQMDVYVRYRNNEGGRKILLVGSFTKDSTNEGQYSDSSVLITMPSDMKDGRCELGFFVQKNMPSGSLDIRSVRLLRATDAAMVVEGAIQADHLDAGSVTTKALSAGAVSADKIAADAITADKLAANAVTAEKIASKTITADQIASGAITSEQIAANAITANHIQANAISVKELRAEVFTQVGTNILPRIPGSDLPAWTENKSGSKYPVMSTDESVYPGFRYYIFDATYMSNHTNRVVVDPTAEYEFSVWVKSRERSTVYIELRDQDGNHAVASGGINNSDPNANQTSSRYLVGPLEVPDVWTQYKTKITLQPNVRSVYVASIYGSHSNGRKGSTFVGEDMTLRPSQISQHEIDRRQDENFVLHENQIKWLRWTKVISTYTYPGSTDEGWSKNITTGLVDIEANYTDQNSGLRLIIRPGWTGTYYVNYTIFGGDSSKGISGRVNNTSSVIDSVYNYKDRIYYTRVTIYPDHLPDPREWVFKVVYGMIQPTSDYYGISLGKPKGFSFVCDVVANAEVLTVSGVRYEQGKVIPKGALLQSTDSVSNGIVLFTEKKPKLRYEIGAPRSGAKSVDGGRVRVPRGVWTELGSWQAPEWGSGISVKAIVSYKTSWNWWNSLAIGVTYGFRVLINGTPIDTYTTKAFGANMDTMQVYKEIKDVTLRQFDIVSLEAFADPSADGERDVLYSHLGIIWGNILENL